MRVRVRWRCVCSGRLSTVAVVEQQRRRWRRPQPSLLQGPGLQHRRMRLSPQPPPSHPPPTGSSLSLSLSSSLLFLLSTPELPLGRVRRGCAVADLLFFSLLEKRAARRRGSVQVVVSSQHHINIIVLLTSLMCARPARSPRGVGRDIKRPAGRRGAHEAVATNFHGRGPRLTHSLHLHRHPTHTTLLVSTRFVRPNKRTDSQTKQQQQ